MWVRDFGLHLTAAKFCQQRKGLDLVRKAIARNTAEGEAKTLKEEKLAIQ